MQTQYENGAELIESVKATGLMDQLAVKESWGRETERWGRNRGVGVAGNGGLILEDKKNW
jgi:hypothetical protein